jgi:ribonuclease PH
MKMKHGEQVGGAETKVLKECMTRPGMEPSIKYPGAARKRRSILPDSTNERQEREKKNEKAKRRLTPISMNRIQNLKTVGSDVHISGYSCKPSTQRASSPCLA